MNYDKHDLHQFIDALEATHDNDLHQFIDLMEASPDVEKQRAFIRMNPNDRATYLYNLRAYARDESITLRKRATLFNIERKLATIDRECRGAGR
jgi:hypothetical protein